MLLVNFEEFMYASSLWTFFLLLASVSCSPVQGVHHLIGSSQPIITAPGDDVILPCQLDPPLDLQRFTVEWSKPDLKPDPSDPLGWVDFVHLYRYGRENLEMKLPSYVSRTKLFTDELKRGNISLKILNVTSADEGRYRCFLPKLKRGSVIRLVVDPNLKNQTTETTPRNLPTPDPGDGTDGRGDQTGPIVWILPVVLLVPLILAAGLSGYLIRRRCQELDGVKYDAASNNPL
ncbi:myelin-oligodendrocyte glycoprotein-like [Seriola lalandi dorsalis]|uniref:Myelin-oligodendrocyte glycoprotein-like n=1 Tax=Seriola lalandi dorsalis TaxID=1841481 RepID=A0A3B4WD74_SERLL|nr:myelin-oligodendrocyte glycoprotein-like [Seriola lalandi dorsalis]